MKNIFTLCIAICTMMTGFAQTDTTAKPAPDTIKIGGMVIIREKGSQPEKDEDRKGGFRITSRKNRDKPSNISTNWWIVDLGFSNFTDNTVYGLGTAADVIAPGSTEDWFKLRGGKSRNVNIWFFMQRINMIKHAVNLKYGVGLELNNYHYDDTRVRYVKNPTMITLDPTLEDAKKNKLAPVANRIFVKFTFFFYCFLVFGFRLSVLNTLGSTIFPDFELYIIGLYPFN